MATFSDIVWEGGFLYIHSVTRGSFHSVAHGTFLSATAGFFTPLQVALEVRSIQQYPL